MSGVVACVLLAYVAEKYSSPEPAVLASQAPGAGPCQLGDGLVRIVEIQEASGVAVGQSANRFWIIKDSGEPVVFAIDTSGRVVDRVPVAGAKVVDWEDLAAGPCAGGRCLYIGDIGDNARKRPMITIYRVPEPAVGRGASPVSAQAFHGTYPDGPHDAEGLFVDRDGRMFVVTKDQAATGIYAFPAAASAGTTSRLEAIAKITMPAGSRADGKARREPATGAALSADGTWLAIRSNDSVQFFKRADVLAGRPGDPIRIDVRSLKEPQGEAIAFGSGATVYLVGEGGAKGLPGTLAQLTCNLS
jgi:hypothetical protein